MPGEYCGQVRHPPGRPASPLHTANEFYSGYPWQDSPRASVPGEAQRPALGSVVSRLRGTESGVPPYVSLGNKPDWEQAYFADLEPPGPRRRRLDAAGAKAQTQRREGRAESRNCCRATRRGHRASAPCPRNGGRLANLAAKP
ncbi:MAG TPA: hypothetical protein VH682_20755 [Gemmataceae bacterium]